MKKIHAFDEVYDAQKMFRLIISALSNPTKTADIGPYAEKLCGENPALLAVAFTLLDNEVGFSVCGDGALTDEIVSLTLSKPAEPEDADYIFLTDLSLLGATVAAAKSGTLRDPHKSATLVVKTPDPDGTVIRLEGPGIKGTAEFWTSAAVIEALRARDGRYDEYPQGIDFIFVSESGRLCAVPRLVKEAK